MSKSFEEIRAQSPCFFLGANTGNGFYNGFDQIYKPKEGERLFIIKGGPGTGKSTLMKNIAVFMEQQGQPCELCFCSSDPGSLDGIRFPKAGIAIVDGTAPHVMEPKYVGVCEEIINVGSCLNSKELENNRKEILDLYAQNAQFHRKANRYLAAASGLLEDSYAIDCEYSNLERAQETALRLCRDLLPAQSGGSAETKRFLSGATPDGTVVFEQTLCYYANTVLAIEDEYGGSASVMMSVIRRYALDAGYSVITCPCALFPERKIDHIMIPQRSLAFTSVNGFLPITVDTNRRIHARRFRDGEGMNSKKQRLRFNRRASEELLDGAHDCIAQARAVHDDLERYYIHAMDFERLESIQHGLEKRLLQML